MAVIAARELVREFAAPRSWGWPFRRKAPFRAVDGVDLEIGTGKVFGLLGPNGSGKTTTILMILGLLPPTRGSVTVLGKPAGDRAVRGRTGFLPEETRLYEFLTGAETLDLIGRLHGIARAERRRRRDELLRRTGMWEARDRRLGTYSKGMARRIGIAQALIAAPDLLILDEPTSGLDPVGNREVRTLLREVAAEGTTVLLTSHILGDVSDVCDEIAILYRGRRILAGTVAHLLQDAERLTWESDTPSAAVLARLTEEFARAGVALHGTRPPATTLEHLFMQALARDDATRAETP